MVVAEAEEPVPTLTVGIDVRAGHALALPVEDAREPGPLEQGHLARGVAGGDRSDVARLDHRDMTTRARQQQARDESRDAGADDEVVVALRQIDVGLDGGTVAPQGGQAMRDGILHDLRYPARGAVTRRVRCRTTRQHTLGGEDGAGAALLG